jgi:hypothetical protein
MRSPVSHTAASCHITRIGVYGSPPARGRRGEATFHGFHAYRPDARERRLMHEFFVQFAKCSFSEWRPIARIFSQHKLCRQPAPSWPLKLCANTAHHNSFLGFRISDRATAGGDARYPCGFFGCSLRCPITRTIGSIHGMPAVGSSCPLKLCADYAHRNRLLGFRASDRMPGPVVMHESRLRASCPITSETGNRAGMPRSASHPRRCKRVPCPPSSSGDRATAAFRSWMTRGPAGDEHPVQHWSLSKD